MEMIIDFIKDNKELLFSGLGVSILGYMGKRIFLKNDENREPATNTQNNNVNVNVINNNESSSGKLNSSSMIERRPNVNILFIDDNHTDFSMVSILKKSGFPNTKSVKDITDLNDVKVKESDIIFVDINGVGLKLFNDQGLGLASALKQRYPEKGIVLYSAESNGDRFHKALREVDGCLYKDAEPYQFITKIEELTDGK